MKAENMQVMTTYVVTKPSTDRSLETGDHVWLSENGALNLLPPDGKYPGWLEKDEWSDPLTSDFTVEECPGAVTKKYGREMAEFYM